jgi:hypothetical protein
MQFSLLTADILLRAGIYPSTMMKKLSENDIERLHTVMQYFINVFALRHITAFPNGLLKKIDLLGIKRAKRILVRYPVHSGEVCQGWMLRSNSLLPFSFLRFACSNTSSMLSVSAHRDN